MSKISWFNRAGKKKNRLFIMAVFFLIAILVLAGISFGFQKAYASKFFPKIKVGYLDIGGLTKEQALEQLKEIEKNVHTKGLEFMAEEIEIIVNPVVISTADPDLAKPILIFHWDATLEEAYGIGRGENWIKNIGQQLSVLIKGRQIKVTHDLDQDELHSTLKANFAELEKPPVNAQLEIKGTDVEVIGEESGYVFDYDKAINDMLSNINSLNFEMVNLDLEFREPEIKKEHTGSAVNSIEKILALESLKLKYDPYWWKVNKPEFTDWFEFQLLDGEVVVGFNKDKVVEFLTPLAEAIDDEARDAKFKLSGKRVTEFQASRDGEKLNIEENYQKINKQVILGDSSDIDLVVDITKAKVAMADVNDLGIVELIGSGSSNFAGSPKNRRHNIAIGAAALNGILIEPGEEFSLLDALGEIDGENGYLQELVIKGDRTIPEFGGGLCQIGTTTFRVALYSGLPITQRRNHSYRVSYYEPAGMDATIYNPYPDMKFLNDTDTYILFTTKIEGDELIFEFYGTKDGREVVLDPEKPSIYNVTSPGEPRYIETEDLEPGQKRKVESAHNGADTYFKYTVTYDDGEVAEDEFYSHYIAWPEVWMVGKYPNASSTEEIVEE